MKKNLNKGFTLIELLVVIAIIGILASVVLASLNSARNKGADAAIKASLTNARAQAELFYDVPQSYSGVCTTGTNNISAMVQGAAQKVGLSSVGGNTTAFSTTATTATCHDSAAGWAAIVSLKAPTTTGAGWCVDSTGTAKEATVLSANSVTCGS